MEYNIQSLIGEQIIEAYKASMPEIFAKREVQYNPKTDPNTPEGHKWNYEHCTQYREDVDSFGV